MLLLSSLGCLNAYDSSEVEPLVPTESPCAGVTAGPWSGHPLSGADLRSEPYSHEAGIQALFDEGLSQGERVAVDLDLTGVVVTNIGFDRGTGDPDLWFADAAGGVRTFEVLGLDAFEPGDVVDLRVTELTSYFGELEITAMEGPARTASEDVAVLNGASLNLGSDQQGLNVEFAGLYIGDSSDDCGANPCITVDNGLVSNTLDLRGAFPEPLVENETCLHVLAPVEFTRGATRIGTDNNTWMRTY